MLNSHSTGIQKFILDRLVQIHDEVITPDPEHRQLGNRPDELLQQITVKLAEADRLLLDQYDSARMEQLCRQDLQRRLDGRHPFRLLGGVGGARDRED